MTKAPHKHAALRAALGQFVTGVTVATTLDAAGDPLGITVNSFNSVSLDPPLVLWSLGKQNFSYDAFRSSGHFAVHVLGAEQKEIAERFAISGDDKFANADWQAGELGSPLLTGCNAQFECRTVHQYEGGDHIIMVGEVLRFASAGTAPLIYHEGQYRSLAD